ncbi:MAG: glycosyltransferase [Bacteroidota bacterium]
MAFTTLLALTTGGYALLIGGLAVAAWRAAKQPQPLPLADDALPRAGVLVAARNEEHTLGRCLEALLAQDYPADRLTIYVANDHSTDRTAEVVEQYRCETNHHRLVYERALALGSDQQVTAGNEAENDARPVPRIVAVQVGEPAGSLQGKANALHSAIGACDEEVLLVTDADCAPPPHWARRMVEHLVEKPHRGAVAGQSLVDGDGLVASVQALDWSYLLTSASGLAFLGRATTAMGNNMAFCRQAYKAVGGYPALPFSVTEDYELWRQIGLQPAFDTVFLSDERTTNRTLPLAQLRDLYMQRRRWARGGLRAQLWLYLGYVLTHLAHLLPLIGLFVAPLTTLAVLSAKWAAEIGLLWVGLAQGGRRHRLWAFPVFQVVLHGYMSTLPYVLLFFPRIEWKERTL